MTNKRSAWTVMVYLAGDNNLTSDCMFALTEMKKASLGKKINVIAQFDPNDPFLPSQRYELNRLGRESTIFDDLIDEARYSSSTGEVRFRTESSKADELADARSEVRKFKTRVADAEGELIGASPAGEDPTSDTDTGSPITLYNFISFCLQEYPAERYMVVLSGHAGGTDRDYLLKDESSSRSLTFNEMKRVFQRVREDREGAPIDIMGMDNCLMSMAEICYELRDCVEVVVGCESYSPASGWPYRQILERLQRDSASEATTTEVASGIVEEYINYYSNYWLAGLSVSQSALNIARVEKLKNLVDKFGQALASELVIEFSAGKTNGSATFKDALVLAHWDAQSYNGERYVDLYDFCDRIEGRTEQQVVKAKSQALRNFLKREFVLKSCYCGATYQYSHGVSIYFPWSEVVSSYANLDFNSASDELGWLDFLEISTILTRRQPRGKASSAELRRQSQALKRKFGAEVGKSRMVADRMVADRKGAGRMVADRMVADRMVADRMVADRMVADRMVADRMVADRMVADRMVADRMVADRMVADRMVADRMVADRMVADRMVADRKVTDRMVADRMNAERMGGPGFRNPVHSMRNPPLVFYPEGCVKDGKKIEVVQERFCRNSDRESKSKKVG